MPAPSLDLLVSLCKRRGFVFPGSEIYGGLANTWDYGPLGAELKNRVKKLWWQTFVRARMDMVGLDSGILMNPRVWEASGHISNFNDPLVDCKNCRSRHRGDKLIEEKFKKDLFTVINETFYRNAIAKLRQFLDQLLPNNNEMRDEYLSKLLKLASEHNCVEAIKLKAEDLKYNVSFDDLLGWHAFKRESLTAKTAADIFNEKFNELLKLDTLQIIKVILDSEKILCPTCGKSDWTTPRQFNLMFKTQQGVIQGEGNDIYLRPETAQGIFINFKNIVDTSRKRLPFGVAQIGKAFRNEITPGNFTFRTREFEQMEIEYFFDAEKQKWEDVFAEWKKASWSFLVDTLGIKADNLRFRDHEKDELSHYSKGTTDIEYKFPWGWGELCAAAAYRTDFDLTQHEKFSGQELKYTDPDEPTRKITPHVMEPSFGSDRITLAIMLDAYTDEKVSDDTRTVMKFTPKVAPVDIAILPLSKKENLTGKAKELYNKVIQETDLTVDFDVTGSIGKRYRRQDEIGTPKCITVDFGTLGEDTAQGEKDTVTIRDRDTLKQERLTIGELVERLRR